MFYIVPDKASAKPMRSGECERMGMGSNNILAFAFCKVQIGMAAARLLRFKVYC